MNFLSVSDRTHVKQAWLPAKSSLAVLDGLYDAQKEGAKIHKNQNNNQLILA
jgi:hypothetical protein